MASEPPARVRGRCVHVPASGIKEGATATPIAPAHQFRHPQEQVPREGLKHAIHCCRHNAAA